MKKTAVRIVRSIIIILVIFATIIGILIFLLRNYHKNNTWATLNISELFFDNPGKEYECVEG